MPDPALTAEQVRKVAALARLAPTDEQVERYRSELAAILGYVERLRTLDLTGVEPLAHISEATNRLDPDEPGPTLSPDTLAQLAPETMGPFIKVPKVIDEGGGA